MLHVFSFLKVVCSLLDITIHSVWC